MADDSLPLGFQVSGVPCGIKASGNPDLALFVSAIPCVAAGVFTRNQVVGAPVILDRARVPSRTARAVIINSGNANACTGERGLDDARQMAAGLAERIKAAEEDVLVCSTGVIGQFLPIEKISGGIQQAVRNLGSSPEHLLSASRAIMTTDTCEKVVTRSIAIAGQSIMVTGVCKGAAMIAPNMATMLAVLMTDAELPPDAAGELLRNSVGSSFNCISVEGHTSTSDTVLLLANGASGAKIETTTQLQQFQSTLSDVCTELAKKIIRDAEGASHFVTVHVRGLPSEADARKIARAVCESPLVKTAIAGNDPNWGRIVSAAGYAGIPFQEADLSLVLNGVAIYDAGRPLDFDDAALSNQMQQGDVSVDLRFRLGKSEVCYWTCDLTSEYIRLNADYRT